MAGHFVLFVLTVVSLIVVPGPDMLYVVGRAVARGPVACWYSALGIASGYVIFTVLVSAGIGLVLRTVPQLFILIKCAGLIYLAYLAYRLFTSDGRMQDISSDPRISRKEDFVLGVITSTLNPKGILFYFSILPQFFIVGYGPLWWQAVAYGITTSVLCLLIYFSAGIVAAFGLQRWKLTPARTRILTRVSGGILLCTITILVITA